jgi:hypothetical protein
MADETKNVFISHVVWLKISAVSTPLKLLRLGVYCTERSRHGLQPEEKR